MTTIIGQVLASTSLDLQGERLSKADLEALLSDIPDPFPLNFKHDMAQGYVGVASHVRIEQDPKDASLYLLKADLEIADETYEYFVRQGGGGFSWSLTVPLEKNYGPEDHPEVMIYLPWPHYNDASLIRDLASFPQNTLIGKWLKKGDGAVATALIVSAVAFALGPTWQRTYDRSIAPSVRNSFEQLKLLWDRRLITIHDYLTDYGVIQCHILLNPDPQHVPESCTVNNLFQGVNMAVALLAERVSKGQEPIRCSMQFEFASKHWRPVSIQYRGAAYENF